MPAQPAIEPKKRTRTPKAAGAEPTRTAKADKPATGIPARTRRIKKRDPEERRRCIAEAAYFRAEQRGFAPGGEVDDWLQAEIEVDGLQDPAAN